MKIIIHGCNGKMGRVLAEISVKDPDIQILCGIDISVNTQLPNLPFPVFSNLDHQTYAADVVIDFTHPSSLKHLLGWCILTGTPLVIATTGFNPEDHRIIQEASKQIPVFQTANMSLGVNVLCKLLKILSSIVEKDFDVEIVEKHHKNKVDAPSGTAFMLVNALGHDCPTHSIRAGTIPGEHTVIVAGPDEVIELTHIALSRGIFARGALSAARFLIKQKPGLYSMEDLM
ncbi:MAG: dihydrodipicolinate reductase C-terminal domain-containing protein [Eubacteriales bacterium]|nr:dihydrodipicolinate reductase C-terminal domain-containing protein [Eubacteriales bacterium]MDD4582569.1 dihydrodipicolinate reductase C-terminal domain-containing protein [Eubacteriales bacterium]